MFRVHRQLLQELPLKIDESTFTDLSYFDENGDEQTLMTHHWIEIGGKKYDFSKGTLTKYIDWINKFLDYIPNE